MRQAGWEDDAELLRLLQLFREHMWHYIYGAPGSFAEAVQPAFPDKQVDEITTMTRSLMSHFAVVLSNKSFRMEGTLLVVDGKEIWVDEHLYETMLNLAENQAGGVWHPDELSRFLLKTKQYKKKFLLRKPAIFFSCIQIWGKSIADSRNKFYALRDMFEREQRVDRTHARSAIEERRYEVLNEVVGGVPAVPNKAIPQLPSSKMPKLWSSDELDMLLRFLVDITLDIQRHGTSPLVELMPGKLSRSEISIVNKLSDMREKYLAKSTYHRAAHLPDTLYDSTSSAYKVFNADWANPNDPNAVGFLALKSNAAKLMARRNRLKRVSLPVKRVIHDRKARSKSKIESIPKSPVINRVLRTRSSDDPKPGAQSAAQEHSKFVRDVAKQFYWSEQTAHAICTGIKNAMHLYHGSKLQEFYKQITANSPGLKLSAALLDVQNILKSFEKRFGSLDKFEEIALGLGTCMDVDMSHDNVESNESPQEQRAQVTSDEQNTGKTGSTLPPNRATGLSSRPGSNDVGKNSISYKPARKKLVSVGKDDSKDMHAILQTSTQDDVEDLDTSPSANQSSPENYNSDGAEQNFSDGDGDAESDDYDTMEIQSVESNDYGASSSSAFGYHESQETTLSEFRNATTTSRSVWDAQATMDHEDDEPCHRRGYDYDWDKNDPETQERSDTEQEDAEFLESEDDHDQPMEETEIVLKQDQQPQWQQDILNSLERGILELEERRRQLAQRRELRESQQGENTTTWSSSELQFEVISVVHGVLP